MPTDHTTTEAGDQHDVGASQRRQRARRGSTVVAVAAVLLLTPLTAACGGDDAGAQDTADGDSAAEGVTLGDIDQTVEAVLTSAESKLGEVGPDGRVVYGWNNLVGEGTGTGSLADGPVGVDMLGNVHYTDGSGDFFGFITFDFGDGDTLAVRMDGRAQAATDTSDAVLDADLEIIGGTGSLEDASGVGRFEGGRPDRLGGAVEGTYSFDLDD
ncbi:MAG: hypothetical protein JJU45_05030 [Acidimicrobiia bacterium]|nr:hypothetical protein [Acidimicrobiia bacterium]